jgi:phage terminase large subunit-like protein
VKKRIDPVRFINNLTHTKGKFAGQGFNLRGWQEDIVRRMFTVRADGLRQYRTCLLMLPRKNGKSELAAAVALYGLLADGEAGAEVYSAAADKDQAALVFNVAAQMVRNDPELHAMCEIVDSQKRIVYRKTGSFYRAISAEAYSKHGFNASMVIYDELHAAPNRELYDVLNTSMGARSQPLLFAISTAGFDRNSILWELYAHAKRVAENSELDPSFLPMLFEAPQDADWADEHVWAAANPALGDFRSLDEMRIAAKRAKEIPAQQNTFRRLYLNQWTEQEERWIDLATWDACNGAVDVEPGRECYAGLDLASTKDITALVLAFPDGDGGLDIVPHFWIPGDSLRERSNRDRVPYEQWMKDGFIHVTNGNVCDYDVIREQIRELAEKYDIKEIAYDRWGATHLVTQLQADGAECVPIGQGFASLSAPTKELDKLITSKALRHGGNPVLRWMAGNVAIEQDAAGNLKPSKKKSREKIDGIVALVMAVDRLTRHEHSASVFEDDDYDMVTL